MIPWSRSIWHKCPAEALIRLMQRGTEFSIRLGHNELMNSRLAAPKKRSRQSLASELRPAIGLRY